MLISPQEKLLCRSLRDFPKAFNNRYGNDAKRQLQELLFRAAVSDREEYLSGLFNNRVPRDGEDWSLRNAQGAVDGAEYTEAARGKPCGHIFKSGEATYRCKTCTVDDTCVLCSRCFEASDHTGHMILVNVSPGNSGCCDCGDLEAWRIPVNCAIHTADGPASHGKQKEISEVPADLAESIRMTIGRAFDYLCDVISCSPEQLRLPKSEATIREDEINSRLKSKWYEDGDEIELEPEFALVLWNDEKHAIQEVQNQVARACKREASFGLEKARETDDIGRSVVTHSRDLKSLLATAGIIENIKITVTIRSARDTFREQMCSTIIEWMLDISGCSVGSDHSILKQTVCNEMLKHWRTGSSATNANIGKEGIDDHEIEDALEQRDMFTNRIIHDIQVRDGTVAVTVGAAPLPQNEDDGFPIETEDDAFSQTQDDDSDDRMEVDQEAGSPDDPEGDVDMRPATVGRSDDDTEASEATYAGYPPPPPPPAQGATVLRPQRTRSSIVQAESSGSTPTPVIQVPKTPWSHARSTHPRPPPSYWMENTGTKNGPLPVSEDIGQPVRLDRMILFDLRLWKKARIDLRDLYISTVVTVPEFKRVLGLRFAGLYTVLAQLYLIADREPDHSIIYLSHQMLTTPSITQEIIEKGNFLTNLIAILYTFLTTRQVGHPWDVSATATLAFDAGSVQNRRMYHFFMDLKHLFALEYVQERLRSEERYVMQFLDLLKLPQGICPNTRAVGEHVEYETDAWISASLLTRELNKLCRQFAEAFKWRRGADHTSICNVIRTFTKATIINSVGVERKRFDQAEIKTEARFKNMSGLGFELEAGGMSSHAEMYRIIDFVVEKEPISFHHALHYTLSWLIDAAKSMNPEQLRGLLEFSFKELSESTPYPQYKSAMPDLDPETYLIALFDYPLRVCAWLAQMKAGMWVRNGLSLRHQMSTYRGVAQRDMAHQRDIFLLQTAMVTCNPSRLLLSMIDRFGLDDWMVGRFLVRKGFEESQMLDVAEDFVHLMIVLLSERTFLQPIEDEPNPQALAIRRDILHILCFKPLSFSDLCSRLADKFQDLDEFQDILEDMTVFKFPEGLSDTGTFELKPEFLSDIDPYIAHYTKNQRDEAETAYRNWISKKTGKPIAEVILEPKLRAIKSGLFKDLPAFTESALFGQVVYHCLGWALGAFRTSTSIPTTRVEAFLQVALHLILIAVLEDRTTEEFDEDNAEAASKSFVHRLLHKSPSESDSIFLQLEGILAREDLGGCHPKVRLILTRVQQRRGLSFAKLMASRGLTVERLGSDSPMAASVEDLEAKKKQATDRAAKVMAQFQKAQNDFLSAQSHIDWGEDDFEDDESVTMGQEEHKQIWKYPSGNCILCQEETNDSRLYGTFGLMVETNILRQTDMEDTDYLREVTDTPLNLDRSAESIRPFGVGGQNRVSIRKFTSDGQEIYGERRGLGKGFTASNCRRGPISTGCGHIMHYACFELYHTATARRQTHQIARNHPERLDRNEFVCPLCKALGNTFLPIIWKGKEEAFPGVLQTELPFEEWVNSHIGVVASRYHKHSAEPNSMNAKQQEVFKNNIKETIVAPSAMAIIHRSSMSGPTSPLRVAMASMPGIFPDDNSPVRTVSSETLAHDELLSIYARIRDTIKKNELPTRFKNDSILLNGPAPIEDLTNTDVLATALGYSISATEIAQRGVASSPGSLLLDKISPLALTHLRILSETASSYLAIGGSRSSGINKASDEFLQTHSRQLLQLFGGHPQIYEEAPWTSGVTAQSRIPAALSQDTFVLLTEASVYLVPALRIEIHHVAQLCYVMEIVKTIISVHCSPNISESWSHIVIPDEKQNVDPEALLEFRNFLKYMELSADLATRLSDSEPPVLLQLYTLISSYALAFLRKVAILLYVRYGVDFPNTGYGDIEDRELDRLTRALRMPSLRQIFKFVGESNTGSEHTTMQSIVTAWIHHWRWMLGDNPSLTEAMRGIRSSHPAIFELIGLPKFYDTLLDEMMRRRCPTTKKDLVEPAICLWCGDIFCSQAVCCTKDRLGGCNQHMKKCGHNIGIFISLRKCMVLFLHAGNGSWAHAPYLDKHGEVDPGLRRSRQLILNQKRYDALLRNVWLQHGVPTTISRKLEADINNGGWETL